MKIHHLFIYIFCLHNLSLSFEFCDAHAGLLDGEMYIRKLHFPSIVFSFCFPDSRNDLTCAQICIWIRTMHLLFLLKKKKLCNSRLVFNFLPFMHYIYFHVISTTFSIFFTLSLIYLGKFKSIVWKSMSNRFIMEWVAITGRGTSTLSLISLWICNKI